MAMVTDPCSYGRYGYGYKLPMATGTAHLVMTFGFGGFGY